MEVAGLITIAVGAVVLAVSMRLLAAANASERIPNWRRAPQTPRRVVALRAWGIGLVVAGVGTTTSHVAWVLTLCVLAMTPFLVLHAVHNWRVRAE